MGEDPYLVSMLGAAYVRGLQSAGVLATLKHFAGYSASRGARNHGPVPMGRRELMDVILPPFEMAVTLAGAGSVMNSYSDVDGVPAGGPAPTDEVARAAGMGLLEVGSALRRMAAAGLVETAPEGWRLTVAARDDLR